MRKKQRTIEEVIMSEAKDLWTSLELPATSAPQQAPTTSVEKGTASAVPLRAAKYLGF
jgi:hypothetical protein